VLGHDIESIFGPSEVDWISKTTAFVLSLVLFFLKLGLRKHLICPILKRLERLLDLRLILDVFTFCTCGLILNIHELSLRIISLFESLPINAQSPISRLLKEYFGGC
jgi:hypothetical protein